MGYRIRHQFLLRGPNADEGKSCPLRRRKGSRLRDGEGIAFEVRGDTGPSYRRQSVAPPQSRHAALVAANDHDRLIGIDHALEQLLDEVGARRHWQMQTGAARQSCEHAAVVQRKPGALIKRRASGLACKPHDMVNVRRCNVCEPQADAGARGHSVKRRVQIERVETQPEKLDFACVARALKAHVC